MSTRLPATCPLPCPPLEAERGDGPDGPRGAGSSLKPGLAEASVPTPPGRPGPLGQTRSVHFCWSGPVKWRTVLAVMLTARLAATTTPSTAADGGVTLSPRRAGPACTPRDRAASDTSTRGDSARDGSAGARPASGHPAPGHPAPGHPAPGHPTAGRSAVGR